jgi:hemoglobin-like flavoprotein
LNVEFLEQSFAALAPRGEEFVAAFYDRLFSEHPVVKPMFADVDMKEQEKKLLDALALVVKNLRKPEVLAPALKTLGQRHRDIGAQSEHFPLVGGVLLKTFAQFMGKKWTPELEEAWGEAYGAVVAGMGF